MDDDPMLHAETAADFAAWLDIHHTQARGVWLVTWRKASRRRAPSYEEVVTEALRFGWVDSVGRKLDDERTMLRFSPRKPRSGWSRPNKERIARLEREGRLEPSGRAAVETAKANGSWTLLDAVENLEVPDDLAAALDARGAREQWDAFPRSARRAILEWIVQAKRPATRERRITETADKAARGERANQWRPPRS